MFLFGILKNIIVLFLILLSVFVFTLPDHILDKIPFVLEIKNFVKTMFSQGFALIRTIYETTFSVMNETGSRLKNGISEGYSSTQEEISSKYNATKDLIDAWGRLTD